MDTGDRRGEPEPWGRGSFGSSPQADLTFTVAVELLLLPAELVIKLPVKLHLQHLREHQVAAGVADFVRQRQICCLTERGAKTPDGNRIRTELVPVFRSDILGLNTGPRAVQRWPSASRGNEQRWPTSGAVHPFAPRRLTRPAKCRPLPPAAWPALRSSHQPESRPEPPVPSDPRGS